MDATPKPFCSECNDEGRIEVVGGDEIRFRQCRCAYAKAMKRHISYNGSLDLARAPVVTKSPLYTTKDDGEVVIDLTTKNLFIKGDWDQLRSHIKWALICKGLSFNFVMVTDEYLKQIFVGNEAKKNRPSARSDADSFNSLRDRIGGQYPLAIIRLGFLGYKNVAMPGLLKEALRIREAATVPTWLLEDDPECPFDPDHRAWSPEVWSYITKNFETFELNGAEATVASEEKPSEAVGSLREANLSPEDGLPPEALETPPDEVDDTPGMSLEMDSVLGGGSNKFKSRTSKYKGRGPAGGY